MAENTQNQLDIDVDGPDEGSDGPQNTSNLTIRRAIRCDRNSPCSHCVHAKIPCTHHETRPKEKRTRILLSAQYERKIDIIDRRLEALTELMRDMKMNMPSANSQPSQNHTPKSDSTRQSSAQASSSTPYGHLTQPNADSPVIEGESSLAAHGEFANEFLKNAVGTESLQGASLELRETLDSLHHIVSSLKQQTAATEMSYPYARLVPRPTLKNHELPPIQTAVSIIRECESENSEISAWIREFFSLENFSGMCLHVYFSEDIAEADFILVNVGLMYMFMDRQQRSTNKKEQEECEEYCVKLRENTETALANLPFHLPATSNMISALLLGAFYAIEISKPSLSWTLSCKASELCQTLGYHRISTMKNDKPIEAQRKKFLFWNTYFIDKSLSLRLGRASTIQDWDVTVPLPTQSNSNSTPLSAFISLWVATARCQGHIYELLYSPDSMTQSDDVRRFRAQKLVADLDDIARRSRELSRTREKEVRTKLGEYFFDFILISDDVLRLSLRTLIYRATPAPPNSRGTFIPECIEAARATLQRHQDCMNLLGRDNTLYFPSYVHWTVLFAPFIPFIVVFCQVIETQDQTDLARLHSFCTSMETSIPLSDAAGKTHRLFQVLYTVALRYIEFRTTSPPPEQTQASAELNNYLAALGFPPAGINNGGHQATPMNPDQTGAFPQPLGDMGMIDDAEGQRGANTMMWMGNTAQLEEWFNSNQQMMELLEEPSFTFPQQQ
ncbi:fungal-specific transcription factor domain-containing protein [Fusarium avenaceum]|nr:fungal-specific transcription factor domain-containing protein [Fusarium avenaceum]